MKKIRILSLHSFYSLLIEIFYIFFRANIFKTNIIILLLHTNKDEHTLTASLRQ